MAEEQVSGEAIENFPGRNITPIFSNAFYVAEAAPTTRIVLGEIVFNSFSPTYSSAVVLPTDVAIDLAQNILRIAKEQGFLREEIQESVKRG